ncbi:MAG: LytR/AlgR family response regulator transcription factor [Bacteroidales bacterium]
MIKAIVVDDEIMARQALVNIITHEHPDISVLSQAGSVNDAFEQITQFTPDVVFLDIKMPDGSGFDLLRKFNKIPFKVIFVTAFDSYTLEAIRFSAFDYILKPINTVELAAAIGRLRESLNQSDDLSAKLQNFFANLDEREKDKKKIVLKTATSIHLVPIGTIIRCEADENYTMFYFTNQPKLLISKPLKYFEEILEQYGFLRVHQSHLINLSHLIRVDKVDGGIVVLTDNVSVPISVRKREQVFRMLEGL